MNNSIITTETIINYNIIMGRIKREVYDEVTNKFGIVYPNCAFQIMDHFHYIVRSKDSSVIMIGSLYKSRSNPIVYIDVNESDLKNTNSVCMKISHTPIIGVADKYTETKSLYIIDILRKKCNDFVIAADSAYKFIPKDHANYSIARHNDKLLVSNTLKYNDITIGMIINSIKTDLVGVFINDLLDTHPVFHF